MFPERSTEPNQDLQGIRQLSSGFAWYPKSEGNLDPCEDWMSLFIVLESLNLLGSPVIWGDFLPLVPPPAQSTGPAAGILLPSYPDLLPSEEWKWENPSEMDVGGQAPQTDGHGRRALTGLLSPKPDRWGPLEEGGGPVIVSCPESPFILHLLLQSD